MAIYRSSDIRNDLKRLGIIKISKELICRETSARELFKVFYPYGISWDLNGIGTYEGYSPLFRELKEREIIPHYDIIIKTIAKGSYKIEAHELVTESNTP